MSPEEIIDMGYQALKIGLLIASPLLLTALITGLIVSIFQAATQINEMTLSFIPKVLMMALIGAFLAPNIVDIIVDYVRSLFLAIPDNIR